MKKIIFILFATIALQPAFSQLKNTKWQGDIKGDNPRNTILDFKSDTVTLYAAADNGVIETMTYTVTGNAFTLKKIDGKSDCDNTSPGKYGFEIKDGKMTIKLISDVCNDRSSAIDATEWTKLKTNKK